MRRVVLAIAFVCLVSATSFAGSIPTGDVAPPPPPPPDETTITGDMPTCGFTSPTSTGDMPAVDLWLTVLGLVF